MLEPQTRCLNRVSLAVIWATRFVVLLAIRLLLGNFPLAVQSNAISPRQYQKLIGPGFSTNWFKTAEPIKKYSEKNIKDVRAKKFSNLRIRYRADLYSYDYTATNFTWFLGNFATVVGHCLANKVIPIISWIFHHAEAYASKDDRVAYVAWWTVVANTLKYKDYKLSFNLFTELGIDECGKNCG